jgi:hypothetical protein
MPSAAVPPTFPSAMQRNALNGQPAVGSVGERLERGIYHLLGARRLHLPGSCFPRTYTGTGTVTTLHQRILRSAHTYRARWRILYATITPYVNFKFTMSGAVTNPSVALPGTANGYSVDDASEVEVGFVLGSNVDSERAAVDISAAIIHAWTEAVTESLVTPGIRIYSWQIIPDDVQMVTGS